MSKLSLNERDSRFLNKCRAVRENRPALLSFSGILLPTTSIERHLPVAENPIISLDPHAAAVVAHFASTLNLTRTEARLFLEDLKELAVSGEIEGVSIAGNSEDTVLEGTIVNAAESPSESEEAEEFYRKVTGLLADPNVEQIILTHMTGFSADELNELGGLPPKEKPFKTGFNA